MDKKPNLDGAYALQTPDDHRAMYRDWARTYDDSFSRSMDYKLHELVANSFADIGGSGPVLDVGAGTGLVAQILSQRKVTPIDATDISGEMLQIAREKDVYRDLIEADILRGLPIGDDTYAGITCAGTFTLGHLGPEILPELIRIAAPNAQFSISINAVHYKAAGFEPAFKALGPSIKSLILNEFPIYGEKASGEHSNDTAFIATFQKK